MSIPAQQIGWSVEAKLIWQIAKELERANRIAGSITTTTTSTTTL